MFFANGAAAASILPRLPAIKEGLGLSNARARRGGRRDARRRAPRGRAGRAADRALRQRAGGHGRRHARRGDAGGRGPRDLVGDAGARLPRAGRVRRDDGRLDERPRHTACSASTGGRSSRGSTACGRWAAWRPARQAPSPPGLGVPVSVHLAVAAAVLVILALVAGRSVPAGVHRRHRSRRRACRRARPPASRPPPAAGPAADRDARHPVRDAPELGRHVERRVPQGGPGPAGGHRRDGVRRLHGRDGRWAA